MKLFGIFACCLVFATAHAKTTTLRYKAVPGDSLTYHVVKTDSASVMGQDQCGTFTADVGMKVETANNSQFTYTGTFHTVSAKVTQPMMGLQDTTITISELVGKRVRLSIAPTGKFDSAVIIDTPDIEDPVTKVLAQQASELRQPWFEFSSNPVSIGDSWTVVQTDSNGDENSTVYDTTTFTCKFERTSDTLHHSCAVVVYTTKRNMAGVAHIQQGEIDIDGQGTGSGTAYFDVKKGILIANNSMSGLDQNLTLAAMQKTITQTQTTNLHMAIVE